MSGYTDANKTTANDEAITVIADGETGSGLQAGVTSGYRLKVDTIISGITVIPSASYKAKWLDMNSSNGGVARATLITDASWTTVYSYTGSGYVHGWSLMVEDSKKSSFRMIVDSVDVFNSTTGLNGADLDGDSLYDLDTDGGVINRYSGIGIEFGDHGAVVFNGPSSLPIRFTTNFSILVKRNAGEGSKKFEAGLITITKD